jgi:hypothetical protein
MWQHRMLVLVLQLQIVSLFSLEIIRCITAITPIPVVAEG